ncbi:hypothetical protein OQI89_15620 [Lentilactobacillus diolivorans]|uniref:hypothetical protein n=1 Tax=Lentilactobacillus diolivorans TaxID=179838 RepID=UPI002468B03F|nr:hypothetical protein [Lentilactobacillus diolivorans]MDH5107252.1 hypothetical protein [Lentilactobacillus diolivorans]
MKKLKAVCYSLAIAFALIMIPLAGAVLSDILEQRDSYFAAFIVSIGGQVIPLALLIYLTIRAFNNFWD